MFEFGNVRFRPVEKEDLKLLHQWENDFEVIMYSRAQPMNLMNMAQIERQFDERSKDEKNLYYIVETINPPEPVGIATIRREEWANVKTGTVGTYIGKRENWGKGIGKQITVAMLEMVFFHLNMERSDAWSVEFNTRAHKALEACGFKKSGFMRETSFVNNKRWGTCYYDILREEYMAQRTKLLKDALGEKLDEYLKRHCSLAP